jgi:transposase-like protein
MSKYMPPYPPEFRAEAIRLARTSGKPHTEIARELGMTAALGTARYAQQAWGLKGTH